MANYSNLLAQIAANIYSNNNQEITGDILKLQLNAMVASLGAGYQFMGVAHPADTPSGYADLRAFWLVGEPGTYTNFGGLVVPEGLSVLIYDSSWRCVTFLNGSFDDFVRKEYSENLVDPAETIGSHYIAPDGSIPSGGSGFFVSDYIEIDGNDISIKGVYGAPSASDSIRPWVAYNSSKQVTRVGLTPHTNPGDTCLYEFDAVNYPNDYYIRIGFRLDDPEAARANYGDTLIDVEYSDYKPVADLEARVAALEDEIRPTSVSIPYYPNAVYKVWNDLEESRQYIVKLGLSRMLAAGAYQDSGICFDNNKLRELPIVPSKILAKQEQSITFSVSNIPITTKERTALASDGENATPKILVIGDSVTAGYGAGANKAPSWLPSCYWAFAKMFFEMDKIDNGGSGHEVLFTGINDGDFTLDYNGTHSVRAKAVAKGGARLDELFQQYWGEGGNTPNPFYDSNNNTFSVNAYLKNYRTMDDLGVRLVSALPDPHGATAIGSDGLTYTIGQLIDTQEKLASYDVCTPTHIFVNLNHNTPGNVFATSVSSLLTTIQNELPGCAFAWVVIDSTGTNFPKDFPDFDPAFIGLDNYVHSHDNSFFTWFRDNLEDEGDDVYLLGLNFIQPEAVDAPFTECAVNENRKFYVADTSVSGAHYHPNNICHCDWGYELYAFIKWLIS